MALAIDPMYSTPAETRMASLHPQQDSDSQSSSYLSHFSFHRYLRRGSVTLGVSAGPGEEAWGRGTALFKYARVI